eukprot:PhM_4_TR8753/c0_g2_i3/m.93510/K04957/HCN4; hyperpolarization activated cyclic nucleotide-gated potassium channel 4
MQRMESGIFGSRSAVMSPKRVSTMGSSNNNNSASRDQHLDDITTSLKEMRDAMERRFDFIDGRIDKLERRVKTARNQDILAFSGRSGADPNEDTISPATPHTPQALALRQLQQSQNTPRGIHREASFNEEGRNKSIFSDKSQHPMNAEHAKSSRRLRHRSVVTRAKPPPTYPATHSHFIFLPETWLITTVECIYWSIAVVEAFFIAVSVGNFHWEEPPAPHTIPLLILASLYMIIFSISRFRVAVTENWHLVDNDLNTISAMYKKSWFKFDVISSIPIDIIVLPVSTVVFRILLFHRVVRVARIPTLFAGSNPLIPARKLRSFMRLVSIAVYGHVVASMIWMIVNSNSDMYENKGPYFRMLTGMNWAIQVSTSVGFGDTQTDDALVWQNLLLNCIVMIIGVGSYSYFIGYLSATVIRKDAVQVAIREKKEKMNSMMNFYDVPWEVQKQAFSLYPRLVESAHDDYQDVLAMLPPFLQDQITRCVRLKLLARVPMFELAEENVMEALVRVLEEDLIAPNQYVVQMGDTGSEMFFIAHGVVEIIVIDEESGEERQVALLKDGSWFGEVAVLQNTKRTASVRTVTSVDLMVLSKHDFVSILHDYPDSAFTKKVRAMVDKYWLGEDQKEKSQADIVEGVGPMETSISSSVADGTEPAPRPSLSTKDCVSPFHDDMNHSASSGSAFEYVTTSTEGASSRRRFDSTVKRATISSDVLSPLPPINRASIASSPPSVTSAHSRRSVSIGFKDDEATQQLLLVEGLSTSENNNSGSHDAVPPGMVDENGASHQNSVNENMNSWRPPRIRTGSVPVDEVVMASSSQSQSSGVSSPQSDGKR